ncbi:MAG: DUF1636 domain-containing protein [Pseudomonadota bacterium]
MSNPVILICTKCRGPEAAAEMRRALGPLVPDGTRFRPVECLAGCDHPTAVGYQADSKASYLFGGIESAEEIAAIGAFAWQYAAHETGWTSSSERPPALKGKVLARLPGLKA